MKRIGLFFFTLCLSAFAGFTQKTDDINKLKATGPYLVAVPDTVNLGEILLNDLSDEHGKVQITIKNEGSKPLILNKVEGCCGTNIKEWTKAPILPGKSGTIRVEFRTEPRPQRISRTVTIYSNAPNAKPLKVPIEGVVIEGKHKNEITL
jgi:hypothetical protein